MTRWVTSDWHLMHRNIRTFEPIRPENFEQVIIERTREVIRPGDELWFCGDLSFGSSPKTEAMLGDLFRICDTFMIPGNHDSGRTKAFFARLGFKEVFKLWAKVGDKLLTHYPMRLVDERYPERAQEIRDTFEREKCTMVVHGHTHSKHSSDPRCVNVSVEVTDFRPVDLDKITLAPPWRPSEAA